MAQVTHLAGEAKMAAIKRYFEETILPVLLKPGDEIYFDTYRPFFLHNFINMVEIQFTVVDEEGYEVASFLEVPVDSVYDFINSNPID